MKGLIELRNFTEVDENYKIKVSIGKLQVMN